MSSPRPGTARGDITIYDGRLALGFIRNTVGGVHAYDSDGRAVGTFADIKAATRGLSERAAGKAVAP